MLEQKVLDYIEEHAEEARELLITLAQIPSPSNHEEKRAEFCKKWLEAQGAEGVFIDEALNVIYPIAVTKDNPVVVFMAHTDVVFPDMEALPLTTENGRIFLGGGKHHLLITKLIFVTCPAYQLGRTVRWGAAASY